MKDSVLILLKITCLETKRFEDCSLRITLIVLVTKQSLWQQECAHFGFMGRRVCVSLGSIPSFEHPQCCTRRDCVCSLLLPQLLAAQQVCLQVGKEPESLSGCGCKYFSWICSSGKDKIEPNSFHYIGGHRKESFVYGKCSTETVPNSIQLKDHPYFSDEETGNHKA